jgi:ABC-type multidrug transport system ATPase subunit
VQGELDRQIIHLVCSFLLNSASSWLRLTSFMFMSLISYRKTTLLDVIAGYKTGGKITGDILIDGYPKSDSTWKAIAGYAEQQDILNPYMSVLETIEFTANCRLPPTVDKQAIINDVIELMGLEAYTNMIVGREKEGEGLPKHARKRLTIANQVSLIW